MSHVPTRIKRHWQNVVDLNCLLTGSNQVQVCHCHGASLRERNPRFLKPKGKKPLWSHWLVIPLREDLHRIMDYDPDRFTVMYDTPAALLDQVCVLTGVNVWERARERRADRADGRHGAEPDGQAVPRVARQ